MDFIDKLIGVVSILFLLSFVVENITFFLRKYFFPKTARNSARFKNFWYGGNADTENLGIDEPAGQVIGASVLISIIVAFLFKVDLLSMLRANDPTAQIAFIFENGNGIRLSNIPGIIVSGFFLSLGSKLFHDLLDLILQIKNTRKAIGAASGSFTNFKTAGGVKKIVTAENIDPLLKNYIKEHIAEIKNWGKVVSVSTFLSESNGDLINGIKVGLEDDEVKDVPATIAITLPNGTTRNILIEKEINLGAPQTTSLNSGAFIHNQDASMEDFGSVGIPLTDPDTGELFVCTCFHVVNREGHWDAWRPFVHDKVVLKTSEGAEAPGRIFSAVFDKSLDVALINVSNDMAVDTNLWGKGNVRNWRAAGFADQGKTQVRVRGANTKKPATGIISEYGAVLMGIKYPGGKRHELFNLIKIKGLGADDSSPPITMAGDSGALVVSQDNMAIGMIVAIHGAFSYAMPIADIMKITPFSLFNIHK